MAMNLVLEWSLLHVLMLTTVLSQITSLSDLDAELSNVADSYFDKQSLIPVQTITDTLSVTVDMTLVSIDEFDDDEAHVTVTGYLTVSWTEERGARTASELSAMIAASKIWTPSLTLDNAANKRVIIQTVSSSDDAQVRFNFYTGKVEWKAWFTATVLCDVDTIKYFPFEEQFCSFRFVPFGYSSSEITMSSSSGEINTASFVGSTQWEIKSTATSTFVQNSASYIEFKLTMSRNSGFYVAIIIMPVIFVSLLHTFVFFIPISINGRYTFSGISVIMVIVSFILSSTMVTKASRPMAYIVYYLLCELVINIVVAIVVVYTEHTFHEFQDKSRQNCFAFLQNDSKTNAVFINAKERSTDPSIAHPKVKSLNNAEAHGHNNSPVMSAWDIEEPDNEFDVKPRKSSSASADGSVRRSTARQDTTVCCFFYFQFLISVLLSGLFYLLLIVLKTNENIIVHSNSITSFLTF